MPTYEYACTNCGVHLEVVQGFSDAPLETCERCGGKLRRVFHPVGVLFKGSGFYSTDSKSRKVDGSNSKKDSDSVKSDSDSKETKSTSTKDGSKTKSTSSSASSD